MRKLFALFIVSIMIFGCATFPAPESENDTMLIIPIEVSREAGSRWFGKYYIDIARSADHEVVKTISLPVKTGEIICTDIPPGKYFIKQSFFVYNDTQKEAQTSIARHLDVRFSLVEGGITVLPKKFIYKIWVEDLKLRMNREFQFLRPEEQLNILKKYEHYDEFVLWKSDLHEVGSNNLVQKTEVDSLSDNESTAETTKDATKSEEAAKKETGNETKRADILTDENIPIVTVFDFEYEGVSEMEASFLVDFLGGSLFDTGNYRIIDRTQREAILSEIQFSLSGCVDESCQLEAGKLIAADYMVIGSLGKIGSRFVINAKLIDIELGETVLSARDIYPDVDSMLDGCDEIALQLTHVKMK